MTRKKIDARLDKLSVQQQQLQAREKALKAKKASQERKHRTRRLIQLGAGVENVMGGPIEEGQELNEFLELLRIWKTGEGRTDYQAAAGQIIEDILGRALQTPTDLTNLRRFLYAQEQRGCYFSSAMDIGD